MLWKNVEIHNAAELFENEDGSISWRRAPLWVADAMEKGCRQLYFCTGVELRFVIRGEKAVIRMSTYDDDPKSFATFHVFRGGIQGGWEDHQIHRHVTGQVQEFEIKRSENMEDLQVMSRRVGTDWDPEVVRVIFDRGRYRIFGVEGDVVPPRPEQCPRRTLLCYGSSITHGSNSIDASHAWPSILGHNLNMDVRNLGVAGSCALEPEFAEYLAAEGERGTWDAATLEVGINVRFWEDEKIVSRVENLLTQVAGRNPDKPVFVISPFYHWWEDLKEEDNTANWRRLTEETVRRLQLPNVTYFPGDEILGGPEYISADYVHPNIYGVQRIADELTKRLREHLTHLIK